MQSKAKIELLRYEPDPNKHTKIQALNQDVKVYEGLSNIIMPKDLHGEYPSLKQIQHKKRNAEKSFDIALE